MIRLAGIQVPDSVIVDLALLLRRHDYAYTADKLEAAAATGQADVALTVDDREAILRVLDDASGGLEKLRAVLLQEHVSRVRDGLV